MKKSIFAALALVAAMTACKKEEEQGSGNKDVAPMLVLYTESFKVGSEGDTKEIRFDSNKHWSATVSEDFLELSESEGEASDRRIKLDVIVKSNPTFEDRVAEVCITVHAEQGSKHPDAVETVTITQFAKDRPLPPEFELLTDTQVENIPYIGAMSEIKFKTNKKWTATATGDFLVLSAQGGEGSDEEQSLVVTVTENSVNEDREGSVLISTVKEYGSEYDPIQTEVKFFQKKAPRVGNGYGIRHIQDLVDFIDAMQRYADGDEEANINDWIKDGVLSIHTDLDLNELNPMRPLRHFYGVIDGQGHKIYNIHYDGDNQEVGLLTDPDGDVTIKNLVLGSADGASHDGVSAISSTISGARVGALVSSSSQRIVVENVVSFVPISTSLARFVGGLVGYCDAVGTAESTRFAVCENKGTIEISKEYGGEVVYYGGIVGYVANSTDVSDAVEFTQCCNSADMTVAGGSATETINWGGIVGATMPRANFQGCEMSGAMTYSNTNATNKPGMNVGGILGTNDGSRKTVFENCNAKTELNLSYNGYANSAGVNTDEYYRVGGICGYVRKSDEGVNEFLSCEHTYGSLVVKAPKVELGGIAGTVNYAKIENCQNKADVYMGTNRSVNNITAVGGIVGRMSATDSNSSIVGCSNTGKIYGSGMAGASATAHGPLGGGILGWESNKCDVLNCTNEGYVRILNKSGGSRPADGGGIIGYKQAGGTCENCRNTGEIKVSTNNGTPSNLAAGGVIGKQTSGTVTNCHNYAAVSTGLSGSGNFDPAITDYSKGYSGSVVGLFSGGEVTTCGAGGSVRGANTSGAETALTAENFGSYIVGQGDQPTDCSFAQ